MDFISGLTGMTVFFIVVIAIGIFSMIVAFFKKVDQGKALIINKMRGKDPIVTFTGGVVLPIIHKSEIMDISLKTIDIDRRGHEGLICNDNIRADIKVTFFVRVNKTTEDVLKVAQAIGCSRASSQSTLEELFSAKFSEALKTVGKQMDFEDLYKERDKFRDNIIELIGKDLNGYVLEDAAIDFLEQTPLSSLDANNVLDSQGIRKIKQLTAIQHVQTNQFENEERMKIEQQNVTASETLAELEKRRADAQLKKDREIANLRDREKAEIESVAEQERTRSEQARITAEEEIGKREVNKQREIEVAEQNRLRVVGIETEKVQLAREQEVIAREREIELQRIEKQKALEEKRREIAEVIRERVAVEKTVAQEEELTKELKAVAEANRFKQVRIIKAEAEAQEVLVRDIKTAEAAHEASKFKAQEKIVMADAEREVSDKVAMAKIRMAEGIQAESAAQGLAQVKVKEANALAIEKEGIAEARAQLEKMQAIAKGEEEKGLAQVRVKEANAAAIQKQGSAEAKALFEKMQATAKGEEEKGLAEMRVKEIEAEVIEKRGMAEVKVRDADAEVVEKLGFAEAHALKERLLAEAEGLAEKFKSMDALSDEGRAHEEFRLNQEHMLKLKQVQFDTQKIVAEAQARILGEAFKTAKIDIIGGESLFFDRVLNATSMAKSVDSFVNKSDTTQHLLKDYLEEDANLMQDIKDILSNPAISSEDVKNLSLSAFLSKLATNSSPQERQKIKSLLKLVEKMGVNEVKMSKD